MGKSGSSSSRTSARNSSSGKGKSTRSKNSSPSGSSRSPSIHSSQFGSVPSIGGAELPTLPNLGPANALTPPSPSGLGGLLSPNQFPGTLFPGSSNFPPMVSGAPSSASVNVSNSPHSSRRPGRPLGSGKGRKVKCPICKELVSGTNLSSHKRNVHPGAPIRPRGRPVGSGRSHDVPSPSAPVNLNPSARPPKPLGRPLGSGSGPKVTCPFCQQLVSRTGLKSHQKRKH